MVDTCQSGTKGLEMLLGGEYDLALLDMKLPDKSRLEILRNVKDEKPGLRGLSVFFCDTFHQRHAGKAEIQQFVWVVLQRPKFKEHSRISR